MIKTLIAFIGFSLITFLIYSFIEKMKILVTVTTMFRRISIRKFNLRIFMDETVNKLKNEIKLAILNKPEPKKLLKFKLALSIICLFFSFLIIQKIIITIPFAVISFFLPDFVLNYYRKKRISKFNSQLVPALKILSNSLRAGTSLSQGMENIVKNCKEPLSEEFQKVTNEIKLGISLQDALENLDRRIKSNDLSIFVTTVNISQQTGGSLPEILNSISETMIERNKINGKIKALTAQGKMSGYVVSMMPFVLMLILYVMSPELIEPMFNTGFGQMMLVFVILFVGIGGLFIRKIVNIDI